jgi:hypothetical protein
MSSCVFYENVLSSSVVGSCGATKYIFFLLLVLVWKQQGPLLLVLVWQQKSLYYWFLCGKQILIFSLLVLVWQQQGILLLVLVWHPFIP